MVSPVTSSSEQASIPTPNQQRTTNREGEFAEGMDDCTVGQEDAATVTNSEKIRGPNSRECLRTQIMVCRKAVGVSVGNNDRDWEPIIEFAQAPEEQNYAARSEGRSKKKVARELQRLKTWVIYDKA